MPNIVQIENNPLAGELRAMQLRLHRVENSLRALCLLTALFSLLGLLIGGPTRATAQDNQRERQENHNDSVATGKLHRPTLPRPISNQFRQES